MITIDDPEMCSGCGACIESCPQGCISFKSDCEGFLYPEINEIKCVKCGICDTVCPFLNCIENLHYDPVVIAAKANDDQIRFTSSSGGLFSVLALNVLHQDGYVCGAVMSDDLRSVHHIIIKDEEELYRMRGSKYVPCEMGSIYSKVKKLLDLGKIVLFSGVSCQIAGLNSYLKKSYENLYTIEILCHGVPSPILWQKYLDYWEKKHNANVVDIGFRSKRFSWRQLGNVYSDKQSKRCYEFAFVNPYFRMFNSEMALRKSCYRCRVKQGRSGADISLGDFWHLEDFRPDFYDNKGISLVLINTEKGNNLFASVHEDIKYTCDGIDFEKVARFNPGVSRSLTTSSERTSFYIDINNMRFKRFIRKYVHLPLRRRIKAKLTQTQLWKMLSILLGREIINNEYCFDFSVVSKHSRE